MKKLVYLFAFLMIAFSCSTDQAHVYEVKQSYTIEQKKGEMLYSIKTLIIKKDNAQKKYGKTIYTNFKKCSYEALDTIVMYEYDKANLEIEKFNRVDNMINKNNDNK